jgi:hypothetical protein
MRIFVSSTFKDLRPERESAQEALRRSQLIPWGMELFVSEPSKPLDVCLEQVQLSDAVILIIGFMARSLIPESRRVGGSANKRISGAVVWSQ